MKTARSGRRAGETRLDIDRWAGPRPSLARALLLLLSVLLCLPVVVAADAQPRLDVVLDSTQHWPGTNDVLMSVYDASGRALADEGIPLLLEFVGPDGSRVRSQPAAERFATYGRRLYRARVPLTEVGGWDIEVRAVDRWRRPRR